MTEPNPDYPVDFKREIDNAKSPTAIAKESYGAVDEKHRQFKTYTEAFRQRIRNDVDWFEQNIPNATIKSIHLDRLDDGIVDVKFTVEYRDLL